MTLNYPMIVLLGLITMVCVVLAVVGFHLLTRKSEVVEEDFLPAAPKKKPNETFILHRITGRIGQPFTRSVLESLPEARRKGIQRRIRASGHIDGLTVESYVQRKTGEVLLYGLIATYFFATGSVLLSLLSLAFIALTDLQLHSTAQKRQDAVQKQLPDFLDVLAVTVGAGLSFRQSLSRVSDAMPGVLADEFRLTLRQMDLGTSRRDAFAALRSRNANESLGKFVSALQQAEELGAPLADALQNISQDMRREDAQYLRRKAQNLNPKVTGITAATMLPGLMLIIGGGLVVGSLDSFGDLFG
ncbi:MAG: type II secretion system F family protein [Nocardiopsaceae bacterium]|nr:type II secretion system F family protein [Nocardiopsaceae bacterium]